MEFAAVERCPVCAGAGPVVYRNVKDSLHNIPVESTYRRCDLCRSLWMDPRPTKDWIPSLYPPTYYTHSPSNGEDYPDGGGVRSRAKKHLLNAGFGYGDKTYDKATTFRWLSASLLVLVPNLRDRVGYPVRYLPYRHGGRLLDVGCGNGAFLDRMARLGWEVEAVEADSDAAGLVSAAGHKVINTTVEEAVLPPCRFDAITLSHVLEHLTDPPKVLAKLIEALRPGGVLVSISPNPAGFVSQWYREHWCALDPPRHLVLPSPNGYVRMLSLAPGTTKVGTLQIAGWAAIAHSIGVKHSGSSSLYRGTLYPKVLDSWAHLLKFFSRELGNEVICTFTKIV